MLPSTFSETIARIQQFALTTLDESAKSQQLYYHNRGHVETVQRRVDRLFHIIKPALVNNHIDNLPILRAKQLLDLCVAAHDMVQVFTEPTPPHSSRKRLGGVSEKATLEKLSAYIAHLNNELHANGCFEAKLSEYDLSLIQEVILGTVCVYSSEECAIYQPALTPCHSSPGLITRILALADIGSLGMDGIAIYNQEGSLLFLEENPDIIPLITEHQLKNLIVKQPKLAENVRQRLLNRACFQIKFAHSRLQRMPQEITFFSKDVADSLQEKAFSYLNEETIRQLQQVTPCHPNVSFEELLQFFQLEQALENTLTM